MDLDLLFRNSERMRAVEDIVRRAADTNATILLQGESGTGKLLIDDNEPQSGEIHPLLEEGVCSDNDLSRTPLHIVRNHWPPVPPQSCDGKGVLG